MKGGIGTPMGLLVLPQQKFTRKQLNRMARVKNRDRHPVTLEHPLLDEIARRKAERERRRR